MKDEQAKGQPPDSLGDAAVDADRAEVAPNSSARAEQGDDAESDAAPDSASMRALLKRALPAADGSADEEILHGVQEKIRRRSGGKFYGDGWSRTQGKYSYLLIALVMLLVLAVGYLFVSPLAVGR